VGKLAAVLEFEAMLAPRHRIAYVDGLRAVAVLVVVASHAVATTIGQVGVELFFIISGFCLSYPTLLKIQERGSANFDVYRYAARRIVRIVPPYWVAIALLFAAGLFVTGMHRVAAEQAMQQAFFLDRGVDFLTGSFWTLPIEFRWYFFFPVALWLWMRAPKAFFAVAFAAAFLAQATLAGTLDLLELPGFMLGIVAAHVALNGHRLSRWAFPACVVLAIGTWLVAPSLNAPLWHATAFIPLLEAIVFLFVVGAGSSLWAHRILSMRWLTAIGLASYSIYLIHGPLMTLAESRGINAWVAALIGIGGGFLFFFVAERPFLDARVRDCLVSQFEDAFTRWFPRVGVPRLLELCGELRLRTVQGEWFDRRAVDRAQGEMLAAEQKRAAVDDANHEQQVLVAKQ
jgi:exopolysaccharide production protein ExoZ